MNAGLKEIAARIVRDAADVYERHPDMDSAWVAMEEFYKTAIHDALLAQRIEHQPSKLGVDGSNPSERAKPIKRRELKPFTIDEA